MAATDAPSRALGSSGSVFGGTFGWPTDENEHIPDVQWPTSIRTYSRMRTDPTLASILAAYETPIVGADWRIDPRGATPEAVKLCCDSLGLPVAGEKADDLGPVRRRGVKWADHIRLACLSYVYGHMPFEPIYEVRDDGLAYLLALPERMPSTIEEINVNPDGSLKSITQLGQPGSGKASQSGTVEIPAGRLIYYCHAREGANWQGRSILRPAYSDWLLKLNTKRVNAVGIERFGAGTPVAEPLPGTNPTPAQIATAQQMVSAIRVGESGGAVPVGFKLRIIGVEGTLPDAIPTLNYFDGQMSRAALTSVLDLGNSPNGSRALGDTWDAILGRALQSMATGMADTATELCERLVDFNWGTDAAVPAVVCGDVASTKAAIAESIVTLIQVGAIRPDAALESFIREGFDLPEAVTPYVAPAKSVAPQAPVDPTPTTPSPAPTQPDTPLAASEGWQPWVRAAGGADAHTGSERKLVDWFLRGADGQIHWGTHGDFEECLLIAGKHMPPEEARGFCSNRHKEATGEWPGPNAHKGIHAAAGDAQPPEQPYRAMTPAEQQAGVDAQQIDADQDALVAAGVAIMATVTAIWAASLTTQVAAALGTGIAGLSRLSVDSGNAYAKLTGLADQAVDSGIRQALAETKHAGGSTLSPDEVHPDRQSLLDAIRSLVDLAAQGFASAVGREATRIAGPNSDPEQVAHDAVTTVQGSDTPIRDFVTSVVARAMGAGRNAAQQAAMQASGMAFVPFASAIRDVDSCEPCLANDQHEYPDLTAAAEDFPGGHYRDCLGRARCRCVVALKPVTP